MERHSDMAQIWRQATQLLGVSCQFSFLQAAHVEDVDIKNIDS